MQWDSVGDEFDDPCRGCQGEDFIGTNAKVALASGSLRFQEVADLIEDLFHYGVLSKIIATAFELRCVSSHHFSAVITAYQLFILQTVRPYGGGNLRHTDP